MIELSVRRDDYFQATIGCYTVLTSARSLPFVEILWTSSPRGFWRIEGCSRETHGLKRVDRSEEVEEVGVGVLFRCLGSIVHQVDDSCIGGSHTAPNIISFRPNCRTTCRKSRSGSLSPYPGPQVEVRPMKESSTLVRTRSRGQCHVSVTYARVAINDRRTTESSVQSVTSIVSNGALPMTSLNNSPNTAPPTSSPPPPSPPMISAKQRATRSYGSKRVEALPSDEPPDADRSFGTLVDGDTSISLSPVARSHEIGDNIVSSQDTKVDDDDDEEKDDSPARPKHQWSWMEALKKLSESEDEAELAPAPPISRPPADIDPSHSPASRDRGAKSKGKRPSTSPRKPQRFPLTTTRSDSRASTRVSAEPEASGSDRERSPSPLPTKQKRRISSRMADAAMVEDSEPEGPRASSSRPRGHRLNSGDTNANFRTSPDPAKRKRKATTGRKPTAKVNCHDIRFVGSY